MPSVIRTALAGLLACAAVTVTAPAHAADPPAQHSVALHQAVATLPLAAENRTGYNRESSFGGWIDADHDGCNTRAEVLLEEAVTAPTVTGTCTLTGGSWNSWYDDTTIDDARALDIDHLVPLAEAWDSGASHWPKARRVAYANYLQDPRHLVAVTARSNRSKADQDPATWMPPSPDATCRYTADWISVKLTWNLSVDPAERDALTRLADSCPDQDIVYTPAPADTSRAAVTAQPRDQIQCPRGYVCIYPDINFAGQPYVKRASDGSVRHLPDYIRGKGSSIINNSSRTARVYQKDNYFGRHVCVGRDGGTIGDLRSYGMNDTTHSLKNNDTPCGA